MCDLTALLRKKGSEPNGAVEILSGRILSLGRGEYFVNSPSAKVIFRDLALLGGHDRHPRLMIDQLEIPY
jgi:hypothetical protein